MDITGLRAELERLFDLDELQQLALDVLGLEASAVSDTSAAATFAQRLVDRCAEEQALEALCDAMHTTKDSVDPRLSELRTRGCLDGRELEEGEAFGSYRILAQIGSGPAGVAYQVLDDAGSTRLKVLRPEATRDRRALARFLTANRLAARLEQCWGLPGGMTVGEVEGRYYVAHQMNEGETLAAYITRMGPTPLAELRPMLSSILETLIELHAAHLTHGALHTRNVLVSPQADGGAVPLLLDLGTDRLRLTSPESLERPGLLSSVLVGAVAPEKLVRGPIDARADLYGFGLVLYELLSGQPPFSGESAGDLVARHLFEEPARLSEVAPRGWISSQLDDLVHALLAKVPGERPKDAQEVLQALEAAPARAPRPSIQMSDEDLEERVNQLLRDPTEEMARHLESAIDDGADPARIAEYFVYAGEQLVAYGNPNARQTRRDLVLRAIRIYEKTLRDLAAAEGLVEGLLDDDPNDTEANLLLVRLRRAQGKHEELIEALVARSEEATSGVERAQLLAQVGKIYEEDLDDPSQALVAYSTAFCDNPTEASYARATERLAGTSQDAWSEVLTSCVETSQSELPTHLRHALWVQMGRWYFKQVARPDLATPVLQSVVAEDLRNVAALEALADIYRSSQQWMELGTVLTTFADATPNPAQARDLRAEAGDILLYQLNEPGHARTLFEQVLAEDPGHERAANSLGKVFEQSGDVAEHARAIEQRSQTLAGQERWASFCRVGRILEDQLHDHEKALARYEQVLAESPTFLDALRGADRCCVALEKHDRLHELLRAQLELARTPREQVNVMIRIAELYEHEFIDHQQAAEIREHILDIEPSHDEALTGLARDLRALKRWTDLVVVYERHLDVLDDTDRQVVVGLRLGEVFGKHLEVPFRAIEAYEAVLKIAPSHPEALAALVELRAEEGDIQEAMEAVEALAATAKTPTERAAHHLRAAKLIEASGDGARAIERFKAAVDADPSDRKLVAQLREAYARRGSHQAAVKLLEEEIETAEGKAEKGQLCAEMARLLLDGLHEDQRAQMMANRALEYDPGNTIAYIVLGDAAFAEDQYLTAATNYERALKAGTSLEREESLRVHECCVESLVKSDGAERAIELSGELLRLAPDSLEVAARVAELMFDHGQPEQAYEAYRHLMAEFDASLDHELRTLATFRVGDVARRLGDYDTAETWLTMASDADPSAPAPLRSLVQLRKDRGDDRGAFDLMTQLLDLEEGERRVELLVELGDMAAAQLHDTALASRHYLRALTEKRDDRKILMKLMQLYSEEKDWRKLVKVILKIAELVDDPPQRAKYLHTAAMVVSREMNDLDQASELLRQALTLAPDLAEARNEALKLARRMGNLDTVKGLLKERAEVAVEAGNTALALESLDELGALYLDVFERLDQAIAVAQSATQLVPDDLARREHLATLYAKDPVGHFEDAVAAQEEILARDPFRAEAYRTLRHIYTAAKWGDSTWCCCQALHALGQATTDEATFFRRLRKTEPAVAQSRLDNETWTSLLTHSDAVPLLTALFAAIQPAVATVCARPLEELGYTSHHRIDPQRDEHMVAQSLHYVAEVLEVPEPPLYENTNDPGMVSFLHATTPSLVLGSAARAQHQLDQATAFISARQITYFRPGFYVRHLIPTGTELKAWLFSTLALTAQNFKVPADLEAKAREPLRALKAQLSDEVQRYLAREVVPRLLESGALDLKRWVSAVDLTADRAGLIMCNDLETAAAGVHGSHSSVPTEQRLEHLFRFAVGKPYFTLRRQLGTAVDL